ncbi:hypothetical protein [Streptomyces canus]|nr:hypothetical protein [Streptomyces canus]
MGRLSNIIDHRGVQARSTAKTAAARKLLALVDHALRDGEVRCLAEWATA